MFKVVDAYLSTGMRFLVKYFLFSVIVLLGCFLTFGQAQYVFEYGEGSSDLSLLDIIFFALLIILIVRHISYARTQKTVWWSSVFKPLVWLGGIFVVSSVLEVCYVILTQDVSRLLRTEISSIEEVILYSLFLITLYLSTDASPEKLKVRVLDAHPHSSSSAPSSDLETQSGAFLNEGPGLIGPVSSELNSNTSNDSSRKEKFEPIWDEVSVSLKEVSNENN